jgi:hypothetical protein
MSTGEKYILVNNGILKNLFQRVIVEYCVLVFKFIPSRLRFGDAVKSNQRSPLSGKIEQNCSKIAIRRFIRFTILFTQAESKYLPR